MRDCDVCSKLDYTVKIKKGDEDKKRKKNEKKAQKKRWRRRRTVKRI